MRPKPSKGESCVKKFIIAIVCPVLLASIAAGCRPGEVIDAPDMNAPVRLGEVGRETVEEIVISQGRLKASEQAVLVAENEGRLVMGLNAAGRRLDEGDEVEAGQIIATLENPSLVAKNALGARKEEWDNAEKALERAREQTTGGLLPDDQIEPASLAAISAKYAYEAALEQLEKLKIVSPVSGRIVKLTEIVDGDRVDLGTEIATVMSYRTIQADVNITNRDFPLIEVGQEARVTNFAMRNKVFHGAITMIHPVADATTGAFSAEITVGNEHEKLRPGMYVQVEIVVNRHDDAIVVPRELLIHRNNTLVVFIVEDQKAVARVVEVGIETKEVAEILGGIEPDDALIVEGFETLRDGTPVSVQR